jgi:hypothetical protein
MIGIPFCLLHLPDIETWMAEDLFVEIEKLPTLPRIGSVESITTVAFLTQMSFEFWVTIRFRHETIAELARERVVNLSYEAVDAAFLEIGLVKKDSVCLGE